MLESVTNTGLRVVVALLIFFIGRFLINKIMKLMAGGKGLGRIDETARRYILTFTKAVLYVALIVTIIAQLGVPMSSVVALLATAGAAIGLALQGALANFAGGLMLLVFRPFSVGDYIVHEDDKGFVESISLVYTVIRTFDNRVITIPNGNLMNSKITNTTVKELRRVDLTFDVAAAEDSAEVRKVILGAVSKCALAKNEPEPVVVPAGMVTDGVTYQVRVWASTADYWRVYEELMETIPAALKKAGIKRPTVPVEIRN